MYSKEQIINEIKRIAEKLGVESLKAKDFEINSTIPLSTLKYYLGSWKQALQEAGLDSKEKTDGKVKLEKGDDDELLQDLVRLYEKHGETPTIALIQKEGKYSERLYKSKWKSLNEAFTLAKKKFLKKEDYKGKADQDKEKIAEQNIEDILDEDENGDEQIEKVLDREKTGEILDRENTEQIEKEEAVIEDPIDFGAMIDEIEKEEKLAKEKETELKKEKKIEKETTAPPKPARLKDEDEELEEVDPNEITRVQEAVKIPEMKRPPVEDKKESKKNVSKQAVDFSDIGLDEVAIKTEVEEVEDEEDKTKEIKIDVEEKNEKQEISHIPQTIQPRISKKKRKEVGEPINFRGLRHAPLNEAGVLYLFGLVSHELGFLIETIKAEFPAGEGKRCFDKENNRWEYMHIDFEYKSSQFDEKGYDEDECDLIVCWIHDWEECPVEILELRSTINYLSGHKKT